MKDTNSRQIFTPATVALDRHMPMPPVCSSSESFPDWSAMRVCIYRLPPNRIALPAVENLRVVVQLSARSMRMERLLAGVTVNAEPSLDAISFNPADEPVEWQWDSFLEIVQMQLCRGFLHKLEEAYGIDAEQVLKLDKFNVHDSMIAQVGHELADILQAGTARVDLSYLDALATFLSLHLVERYCKNPRTQPSNGKFKTADFSRIVEYIHDNLDKDLRLEQVAKLANLSNFYFIKLFKSQFGKSPHQYILECRIELAKRLLSETFLPINEISQRCGFCNQSHFTSAFRNNSGAAPRAYRQVYARTPSETKQKH
jgi:AraC family transcriptional regulator